MLFTVASLACGAARRNMAIATWSSAATAAGLVAPVLGGVLVDVLSWRAMFLVNVPVGVLAFVLAAAKLPAQPRTRAVRVDWAGAALLIVSLGVGNFALLRGAEQSTSSTGVQSLFAAGTFAALVVVQLRTSAPSLDLALFRILAFTGAHWPCSCPAC